jgi:hypothetical protein
MNGQVRPVEPAELLGARMHMDEPRARTRDVHQRIGLRGNFSHAAADEQDQIGVLETRQQLGIGTDPEVAGVAGMQRIEQRQAPVAGGDRQLKAFGEPLDGRAGVRRPAGAAEHS